MRPVIAILLLLPVTLLGCDSSDPEPRLEPSYVLVSVDGGGVPAVLESWVVGAEAVRQLRVVGRTITFVSADSAEYALSRDVVEPLPEGGMETWASSCVAARVPYQRVGDAVILRWDPNQFVPVGQPPSAQPAILDTLYLDGDRLRHRASAASLMAGSTGRRWELEYRAGASSPLCGDLP
jgi:hypothetical protein